KVLHREVDPVELAPRNRQVARYTRTGAQHGRVERGEIVRMHVGPESELDSFFGELLDAPLDDVLLDLEVGHPEAQEAAACRFAPAVAIDEVVPIRDEVPERAAVMTERHAALHAASTLLAELDERKHAHELEVVAHPLARRAVRCLPAVELLEAADLAHIYLLAPFRGASARSHRFASLCFPARAPARAD